MMYQDGGPGIGLNQVCTGNSVDRYQGQVMTAEPPSQLTVAHTWMGGWYPGWGNLLRDKLARESIGFKAF